MSMKNERVDVKNSLGWHEGVRCVDEYSGESFRKLSSIKINVYRSDKSVKCRRRYLRRTRSEGESRASVRE